MKIPNNDQGKILAYLLEHNEITSLAATLSLGITRLSARVFDIKRQYGDDCLEFRWMVTKKAPVKAWRLSKSFRAMLETKKPDFPSDKVFG